jgi:hypothetical protein
MLLNKKAYMSFHVRTHWADLQSVRLDGRLTNWFLPTTPKSPISRGKIMSGIQRRCDRCAKNTLHQVEPFSVPRPLPTPVNRQVDLTGRNGGPAPVFAGTLPEAVRYRCTICGYVTVMVGPEQKLGSDVIDQLRRGSDWVEPK